MVESREAARKVVATADSKAQGKGKRKQGKRGAGRQEANPTPNDDGELIWLGPLWGEEGGSCAKVAVLEQAGVAGR